MISKLSANNLLHVNQHNEFLQHAKLNGSNYEEKKHTKCQENKRQRVIHMDGYRERTGGNLPKRLCSEAYDDKLLFVFFLIILQ